MNMWHRSILRGQFALAARWGAHGSAEAVFEPLDDILHRTFGTGGLENLGHLGGYLLVAFPGPVKVQDQLPPLLVLKFAQQHLLFRLGRHVVGFSAKGWCFM